jgi:hypothetical protein
MTIMFFVFGIGFITDPDPRIKPIVPSLPDCPSIETKEVTWFHRVDFPIRRQVRFRKERKVPRDILFRNGEFVATLNEGTKVAAPGYSGGS